MPNHQHLNGPDFLDAVAQAELGNGMKINSDEYSRRAEQWREDLQTLSLSQAAVDTLQRAQVATQRDAANAYDILSRVRPDSIDAAEYELVRQLLADIGHVGYCAPAWADRVDQTGRNPRQLPMPGDRYYLPVEVVTAEYKAEGISVSYAPMLRNEAGELEPRRGHPFSVSGTTEWTLGAVGVVASPRRALNTLPAAANSADTAFASTGRAA